MGKIHTNPRVTNSLGPRLVILEASTTTILATQSGAVISSEGAGSAVVYTLPAAASGLWYDFVFAEDQDTTIQAASAIMILFGNVAATSLAFTTSGEKTGQGARVWSDGNKWFLAETCHEGVTPVVA